MKRLEPSDGSQVNESLVAASDFSRTKSTRAFAEFLYDRQRSVRPVRRSLDRGRVEHVRRGVAVHDLPPWFTHLTEPSERRSPSWMPAASDTRRPVSRSSRRIARSRTEASPSKRRRVSSGTGSMSLTGTRGLRSERNALASASSSAWSQLPNALSVRTYPATLTGASVVRSSTSQARTSGADSPSTGRPWSNARVSRARIIRYQAEVLGEMPSAALAARNRSTA